MYIELKKITKKYQQNEILKDVDLGIEKGSLTALLGPSGSGKTTILRVIAGLEDISGGQIFIDEKDVTHVSPSQRGIGFVFQNYALFKHVDVYDNIAFGLRTKKIDEDSIEKRVNELLELTGLTGLGDRYPHQLSGGQRQRVAFARALAPNPKVLLLDEPFAAVDAKIRKELRIWLRNLIHQVGITSIFVTHDHEEAIEVADTIIVTNAGAIEQIGEPAAIYASPKSLFVAEFIGNINTLENIEVKGFDQPEGNYRYTVRPENILVHKKSEQYTAQASTEEALVKEVNFRGARIAVLLKYKDHDVWAERSIQQPALAVGETVDILIHEMSLFIGKEATAQGVVKNKNIYAPILYTI